MGRGSGGGGWGRGAMLQLHPAPALLLAPAPLLSEGRRGSRRVRQSGGGEQGRGWGRGAGGGGGDGDRGHCCSSLPLQLSSSHHPPHPSRSSPRTCPPAVRAKSAGEGADGCCRAGTVSRGGGTGAGMGAVLQLPLAHALPPHTYSPAVRATAQHGGQGRQPTGAAERGSRAGEAGGGDGVRHPVQLLQLSCFCSPPVPPS